MDSSNKPVRYFLILLRVALGIVFAYAAYVKLREPWELFALAISSYNVIPLKFGEFVARTLPWAELVIGLMLITGIGLRVAATATSLMLLVFFSLMVRAFVQGKEISCGCFGNGELISWWTLLRDGSMLASALLVTWMAFRPPRRQEEV